VVAHFSTHRSNSKELRDYVDMMGGKKSYAITLLTALTMDVVACLGWGLDLEELWLAFQLPGDRYQHADAEC